MLKDKYEEKEQYIRYLVPTTNDILHFAAPNVQWVERTCLSHTQSLACAFFFRSGKNLHEISHALKSLVTKNA